MGIIGWHPAWLKWHWADAPDGVDCHKKVVWAGKWTLLWGSYVSWITTNAEVIDGRLIVANWGVYASRFARTMLPLAALGPLYASVTCLSASFRGKNDVRNHVFGAASTSAIWYITSKRWHTAIIHATWCCLAAAILQSRRIDGDLFEFFPNDYMCTNLPQRSWHSRGPVMDFSPTKYYKPMQSQYYFPAAAEKISTYMAKPSIIRVYPATEVRVEYNGIA